MKMNDNKTIEDYNLGVKFKLNTLITELKIDLNKLENASGIMMKYSLYNFDRALQVEKSIKETIEDCERELKEIDDAIKCGYTYTSKNIL